MKKIIHCLVIALMAITVFLTTNKTNTSSNINLTSLITLNTANAECIEWQPDAGWLVNDGICLYDVDESGVCNVAPGWFTQEEMLEWFHPIRYTWCSIV